LPDFNYIDSQDRFINFCAQFCLKAIIVLDLPEFSVEKSVRYINVLLGMMQSICDEQYTDAQDLCRIQPNGSSVNLPAEVCDFLDTLCTSIDAHVIDMTTNAFETLCEFTRGNLESQAVVYEYKIMDTVNDILRTKDLGGSTLAQRIALHTAIVYFIIFGTEENREISIRGMTFGAQLMMAHVNKVCRWVKVSENRYFFLNEIK